MDNFFAGFNTTDSYAILFIMLLAFLFGLIVGLLLRGRRIRALKAERDAAIENKALAETELAGMREQLALKDADMKRIELEIAELHDKIARHEEEKSKLYYEIHQLNAVVESQQSTAKEFQAIIDTLETQLSAAQITQQQLQQTLEEEEKEEDSVEELAAMQSFYNASRMRMDAIEEKLRLLESENSALRQSLDDLKPLTAPLTTAAAPMIAFSLEEEPEEVIFEPGNKDVLREKIVIETPPKDDLSLIKGVGPFLEQKLNQLGIFTFDQISQWDQAEIERVTHEIGYFPGRIEKDDWVGQARRLLQLKQEHPWALQPLGIHSTDNADLKIVEGIGPKIEALLKEAGINTWDDLADTAADRLQEILAAAGEAFRIHDPTSWPMQAQMAANGQWDLLREYQEELKGGRIV